MVHLEPRAPRGTALLSYILDPFLVPPGAPVAHHHTQDWESLEMGSALVERGLSLDVIHWTNDRFTPRADYDLVIDPRGNLERLLPQLSPHCLKLFHADTAHHLVHNAAERARLDALEARRGVRLKPRRLMPPNRALEVADAVTVLGNEWTAATYRHAGKPVHRVPISAPLEYPWPAGKDFAEARRRFLWFGSGGMVHKGLDLVLEAFAGLPALELTICGPVENEDDFVRAYARELYATPNIRVAGFVDVASPAFAALTRATGAVVYPSSSEGGGGSVITCMHASLVPVVTREASVDVPAGGGIVLGEATVDAIRDAVLAVSTLAPAALEAMARASWEHVRRHHTRARFAAVLRETLDTLERDAR